MTLPEAVLLDLDGTLLDHDGAARSALGETMRTVGLSEGSDLSAATSLWRRLERIHFQEYLDGNVTFEEQRVRRVRAFLAHHGRSGLDRADVLRWFEVYRRAYEAAWRAYDDVAPFLHGLALLHPRLAVAVVTNGDHAQQLAKLEALGLARLRLFSSSSSGVRKPDRRIFRGACTAMGVEPGAAWFIGDDVEADARGAEAAGLRGIWLDRQGPGDADSDSRSTPRASSLLEVLRWLRDGQEPGA